MNSLIHLCWTARKLPIRWTRSELISVLTEGNTSPHGRYRAWRLPSAGTTSPDYAHGSLPRSLIGSGKQTHAYSRHIVRDTSCKRYRLRALRVQRKLMLGHGRERLSNTKLSRKKSATVRVATRDGSSKHAVELLRVSRTARFRARDMLVTDCICMTTVKILTVIYIYKSECMCVCMYVQD
jgi:hypothetical protein